MPLPLSSVVIAEKNKLATDGVFFGALEIRLPGVAEPIRVTDNKEDVTWSGNLWQSFPFKYEPINENSNEVPQTTIRIGNVSRVMEGYVQAYDLYCKTSGYSPIEVRILVLNSKDLSSGVPVVEHVCELKKQKTDALWATFIVGAANPANKRYPKSRILKNHCRFLEIGGFNYPVGTAPLCGAPAGSFTTCGGTLFACRERSNSTRFGGSPGVGSGGIQIA